MTLQQVLIALHIDATHVTIDDVLCMVICIGKFASDRCWQAFAVIKSLTECAVCRQMRCGL